MGWKWRQGKSFNYCPGQNNFNIKHLVMDLGIRKPRHIVKQLWKTPLFVFCRRHFIPGTSPSPSSIQSTTDYTLSLWWCDTIVGCSGQGAGVSAAPDFTLCCHTFLLTHFLCSDVCWPHTVRERTRSSGCYEETLVPLRFTVLSRRHFQRDASNSADGLTCVLWWVHCRDSCDQCGSAPDLPSTRSHEQPSHCQTAAIYTSYNLEKKHVGCLNSKLKQPNFMGTF